MTGAQIERIRRHLALTQAQFGRLFGVHNQTVSKWERELLAPSDFQRIWLEQLELRRERGGLPPGPRAGGVVRRALASDRELARVWLELLTGEPA